MNIYQQIKEANQEANHVARYWTDQVYPESPGYKENTTSKQAAESLNKDKIRAIHQEILGIIGEGKTTEEIIDTLWQDPEDWMKRLELAKRYHAHATYIRPRVTELLKQGLIKDSGLRRDTFGGHSSKVWIKINPGS